MNKEVISVNEDATIEEAALIMYNHKIGGLPVVSSVGAVVGVITETDIFKTFVDVMGLQEGKTRLTLLVDNKVGVVYDIAGIFTECGLSIDSLVSAASRMASTRLSCAATSPMSMPSARRSRPRDMRSSIRPASAEPSAAHSKYRSSRKSLFSTEFVEEGLFLFLVYRYTLHIYR